MEGTMERTCGWGRDDNAPFPMMTKTGPLPKTPTASTPRAMMTTSTPGAKMMISMTGATMIMSMLMATMTKSMPGAMTIWGKECYNQLVFLKAGSNPNESSILLLLVICQWAAVLIFLFWGKKWQWFSNQTSQKTWMLHVKNRALGARQVFSRES
jgi:hypothetical protein